MNSHHLTLISGGFDDHQNTLGLPDLLSSPITLGIFGRTGCGKTTLLKGLIENAISQGLPVMGLSWTLPVGLQDESLKDLPVQWFNLYDSTSSKTLTLYQAASTATIANPRSLLFLDEVGAGTAGIVPPAVAPLLGLLCAFGKVKGCSIVLTAQSVYGLIPAILENLTTRLIGRIERSQIDEMSSGLDIPSSVLEQCGSEEFDQKADGTLWLCDHFNRLVKENRSFSVRQYRA